VFKEEIAKKLECDHPSVIQYLIEQEYIDFLRREELQSLDVKFKTRVIRRNIRCVGKLAEKIDSSY